MSTETKESDRIVAEYLAYILQIRGRTEALRELGRLLHFSPMAARREIAMAMLRKGDQHTVADSLALLEGASVPDWQRANAASALVRATSPRVRSTLDHA